MASACQEAGLPTPIFEEIGMHFRVTIRNERIREPKADDIDRRMLALLSDGLARSTSVVAKHIGLSQRATLTRLKAMPREDSWWKLGPAHTIPSASTH